MVARELWLMMRFVGGSVDGCEVDGFWMVAVV